MDPLSGTVLEDHGPETGYLKGVNEIIKEVIDWWNCWRVRFNIPAAEEDVKKHYVALADSGVLLFEVCCLVLYSSEWFDTYVFLDS